MPESTNEVIETQQNDTVEEVDSSTSSDDIDETVNQEEPEQEQQVIEESEQNEDAATVVSETVENTDVTESEITEIIEESISVKTETQMTSSDSSEAVQEQESESVSVNTENDTDVESNEGADTPSESISSGSSIDYTEQLNTIIEQQQTLIAEVQLTNQLLYRLNCYDDIYLPVAIVIVMCVVFYKMFRSFGRF